MDSAAGRGPGLGAQLRKARERRGLTQAELGSRLNLAAGTIDALEREDLLALPGPVYVRGYLRRLAAELEIDEAELQQAHTRIAGESAPAPRRPTLRAEPMRAPRRVRRFLLLVIVVVAIVVAGLLAQRYLPEIWLETGGAPLPQDLAPLPGAAPGTPAPAMPLESIPLPPQPLPPDESHSPGDESAAATPYGALPEEERGYATQIAHGRDAATPYGALPEEEPRAAEPPPLPAATDMPQVPSLPGHPAPDGPATAAGVAPALELRASTADSWVQVKDATGKVLLEEVLKPGSTRRVHGPRPLRVMVGNAAATSLVLDGQAVDLSPHTRPSGTAFIASLGG
ncbi:MAG: helix-turn-helix domain-containing protein [Pseudomonadota bacterium]